MYGYVSEGIFFTRGNKSPRGIKAGLVQGFAAKRLDFAMIAKDYSAQRAKTSSHYIKSDY